MNPTNLAWLTLLAAGLLEIAFTTSMKLSKGFTKVGYTSLFVICAVLSLALVERASRVIPLGTAYAVWTGIGAVGTVAVGILAFGEPPAPTRLLLIAGIIACVVGLKLAH